MSEVYGPVYEAYIDAYMKEYTCSRELAVQSLNNILKGIKEEDND